VLKVNNDEMDSSGITRIVLADPHALVRAGIAQLIAQIPDTVVVGEAGDGERLLALITDKHPHIMLSELSLDGMSGLDVARRVHRHLPTLRILFLSSQADSVHVRTALKAGASGYLSKSGDPQELGLAIRAVMRGQIYLSPGISHHAIERRRAGRAEDSVILSPRQREVLRLIGKGKSTKEIADLLGLGAKTIETHRARLMQALSLNNTNALVHFAVRAILESADE